MSKAILEKFDNLFREQLDKIKNINKGNKPPLIHILGDFNFRDIVWPDRLRKSGLSLSQTEGQILIDIMNVRGLEQLDNFPTRKRNTLDLILSSLPGQFADIHSQDKLIDHDIVSGTLKIAIPPIRVSIEGVKKLCIDFSNNQKLRYAKYHIYGQCKKWLKTYSKVNLSQ